MQYVYEVKWNEVYSHHLSMVLFLMGQTVAQLIHIIQTEVCIKFHKDIPDRINFDDEAYLGISWIESVFFLS